MKKIFAKELAALAVLALAFTGCNTAFDGTNANFSEKESEYTEISGATASFTGANKHGDITCTINGSDTGTIAKNNNKNVIAVTITSFSKIDLESADKAIHFQHLTNNQTSGYYPIRGADLPKTRIAVNEPKASGTVETTIVYEVNGTGVTTDKVALFVDAKELKTKGGSAVLALDKNTIRGEESDSFIKYLDADGDTAITGVLENFCPKYFPINVSSVDKEELHDASGKLTGVYRFKIKASDKNENYPNSADENWEIGLAAKLNDAVVIQYRKPGSRTYEEKKLTWIYRDANSKSPDTDPYSAHYYTADTTFDEIGTEWRAVITIPDDIVTPAWYKDVYGHPAIVYSEVLQMGVGAKIIIANDEIYTLHKTVPSYIVVPSTYATTGLDKTSSYVPKSYTEDDIRTAQASFFTVSTINNNSFKVETKGDAELDPNAAKDFIVVDANNKKIAADVDVITFSYNDSTATSGKVNYVKITLKDVRYRNYSGFEAANKTLKILVGSGTKIKENKTYPSQLTFGQWKDVADDDASGYVQIYPAPLIP